MNRVAHHQQKNWIPQTLVQINQEVVIPKLRGIKQKKLKQILIWTKQIQP